MTSEVFMQQLVEKKIFLALKFLLRAEEAWAVAFGGGFSSRLRFQSWQADQSAQGL